VTGCPEISFPTWYLLEQLWEDVWRLNFEDCELLQELSLIVQEYEILLTEDTPDEVLDQVQHDIINLQVALKV
jgi:hypothetical protein